MLIIIFFFILGSEVGNSGFKLVKNDLIAELKLSHNVGGVSKLRTEQAKYQEEIEKENYKKFLAQFTMENFLSKVIFFTTHKKYIILFEHDRVGLVML